MLIPEDLRYSSDHEWAKEPRATVRVGITDYAQDALGDVVFVDLPKVGAAVDVGGSLGEVESTKSVSEIYAPVSGTVVSGERRPDQLARVGQLRPLRGRGGSARSRPPQRRRLRRPSSTPPRTAT